MKTLTEQMPSSGQTAAHEHKWQRVVESSDDKFDTYICAHENCSASKRIPKPRVNESKGGKQLLLG